MPAEQVNFQATLTDNVSPNLEKLEKQLKEMGQSPTQIKMVLDAVDQATPKVKQAQQQLDRLPKKHTINIDVRSGLDKAREEFRRAREEFIKPIKLPFDLVDTEGNKLDGAMSKLFTVREKVAMPLMGSMPGANMLYGVGAGAGIAGAITSLTGTLKESVSANDQIEQAQQKLTIALRDSSGATTELHKVIAASQKVPFTFQQMLQADVMGRSYQLPMWPGQNKNVPQGYMNIATNMASAMGTSPEDSTMALSMARQHMFRRLQMFGIRMTAQDYGAGGRFAGMSVDQALELATKRFQGASKAQMGTLQGMMSNIKDVISQQVVRPVGENIFGAIHQRVSGVEGFLQDPTKEKQIGEAVEKFQHFTVTVMQQLAKVHQYFDIHLKQPLEDVISMIKQVGSEFAHAFGGTTATVIKTFSEALLSIVGPLTSIVKDIPGLGTVMGYTKGMQMIGLGGTVKPLQHFENAINPNSHEGILSGVGRGIMGLPSMILKLGGIMALKSIIDAHKASVDMNNQFKDMGGHMDHINSQVAEMAMDLGKSETSMKNLVSIAAQGIPHGRMKAGQRADLSEHLAQAGVQLGRITGWSDTGVIQAIQQQMKQSQQYSSDALHKFGTDILQTAAVAKQFGMSLANVMQIIQTFAPQAGPIGLGGLRGAPSIVAAAGAVNRYGVTSNQQQAGHYTPDSVLQQMLQQYGQPTIEDLRAIKPGNLGNYWSFRNRPGMVKRYGADEAAYQGQAKAASALQGSARSQIGQIAPSALQGGPMGVPPIPVLWDTAGLSTNFGQFNRQGQNPEKTAELVKKAWGATVDNYNKAVQKIADYNAKVDQTQNTLTQFNQAQASVNLQMQAFQHYIQVAQRALEDAQLALSRYTLQNLAPLEKELNAVQNAMDKVNHSMSDAQYNMTKFADGLLTGEQAALNQLHALSLYNEQLNYLKMQYTQIGAQLGTQVYTRGFSARVAPLMGLSLEMQMQQLQRKQQMEQSKYDITYGEGHYQMQQAQRSIFQRTEMPLNDRLHGIKQAQAVIDQGTMQTHRLTDIQFGLQQRMYVVNRHITDQQNHITALQNSVTALNQSGQMRHLQDEQYNLGQVIGETNIKLTQQQNVLSQWTNTLDDLNQKKQDLQSLFDSLITFPGTGDGGFNEMRKVIKAAGQTGLLPGGHEGHLSDLGIRGQAGAMKTWIPGKEEKYFLSQIDTAQKKAQAAQKAGVNWWHKKGTVVEVIKDGILGAFTGDLWLKLADMFRGLPGIGGVAATGLSAMGSIAPILTTVATALIAGGSISYLFKRALTGLIGHSDIARGAADVAGLGISKAGKVLSDIPGLRWAGRPMAELTGSAAMLDKLKGSWRKSIREVLDPLIHPIRHWRTILGRVGGAALGSAVAGPPGGVIGSLLGGKIFRGLSRETAVDIERALKHPVNTMDKAAGKFVKAGEEHLSAAKKATIVVKGQEYNLEDAKKLVSRNGTQVSHFKDHVASFKDHVGTFWNAAKSERGSIDIFASEGRGVGRFAKVIGIFATAAQLFSGAAGDIIGWIKKTLHIGGDHPGSRAISDVRAATRGVARRLHLQASTEEDAGRLNRLAHANPQIENILKQAGKAGAQVVRVGGKVLRVGATAAGALSFLPAGLDAIQGKWGKAAGAAANAGTYFVPGVGETRMVFDLLGAITGNSNLSSGKLASNLGNVSAAGPRNEASYMQTQAKRMTKDYWGFMVLEEKQALAGIHDHQSKAYKDGLKLLAQYQANSLAAQRQMHDLDFQEHKRYDSLTAQQQQDAQKAAISGPFGLVDYLQQVNNHLNHHWTNRLAAIGSAFTAENQAHNQGYQAISSTTHGWLGALQKQIDTWSKQMGLPLTKGQNTPLPQSVANQAAHAIGVNLSQQFTGKEHGGLVHADPHKHKLGHGKLVRMAEEGHPEMVIPLAPHRRERAKHLLKEAHGMIGKKYPGYKDGGYVYPFGGPVNWERTDMGVDFSMAPGTPIAAIGDAKIEGINQNWYAGQPYLWYQLLNGVDAGKHIYLAEQIAPLVKAGQIVKAGQAIAKYASSGTGIEMGWGTAGWKTLQQQAMPGSADKATSIGTSFRNFVQGLQHGKILNIGGLGGMVASNVKPIHLKKPPGALNQMGIVGGRQHSILDLLKGKWQKHLNHMTVSGLPTSGGGTAGQNQALAKAMLGHFGWGPGQMGPLIKLWNQESGWSQTALNKSSGAFGIPQSLPANKMAAAGPDWRTNPATQIKWGLEYIKGRYGSPAGAWAHEIANNWYAGGLPYVPKDNTLAVLHQGEAVMSRANRSANHGGQHHHQRHQRHTAHPMLQQSLTTDKGWNKYTEQVIKNWKSIFNLEYDIHHIRRYMEDILHKKPGKGDTAALEALNAALRAARAAQSRLAGRYNRGIAGALRRIHDPSSGEDTQAGVMREKEIYKKTVKSIEAHDPVLRADFRKLHKDQAKLKRDLDAYHKLWAKVHAKNHHESQAERKRLRQLANAIRQDRKHIHSDEIRIRNRQAHDQKVGLAKYLEGAAGRGVNALLIKAITGHTLTKAQAAAYKAIENATRAGAHTSKEQMKILDRNLERSLGLGVGKIVKEHKKGHTGRSHIHKSVDAHRAAAHADAIAGHTHLKNIHEHLRTAHDQAQTGRSRIADRAEATRGAMADRMTQAGKHHKDITNHHLKHVNHMNRTEQHQRKLEDKLERLANKNTVVNINVSGGTSTRVQTR